MVNEEIEEEKIPCSLSSIYDLRKRKVKKYFTQEPDDCDLVPKQRKVEVENFENEADSETWSQESVSLLRECYEGPNPDRGFPQFEEECMESTIEVMVTDSDEDAESVGGNKENDKSVQTDFSFFRDSDKKSKRQSNFLVNLIKLQIILSSDKTIPIQKLSTIFKNMWGGNQVREKQEESVGGEIPKETMRYLLRSGDADVVLKETLEALLDNLSEELDTNVSGVAACWRNSVFEEATEATNRAVNLVPALARVVCPFLGRLIDSLLQSEGVVKNIFLESKSMFLINFCRSTHLSFFTISYSIQALRSLESFHSFQDTSPLQNQRAVNSTKNAYYILRVLEYLLNSFKKIFEELKGEQVFSSKRMDESFGVLEMWRKLRNDPQGPREKGKDRGYTEQLVREAVAKWTRDLDLLLLHCVRSLPLMAFAVERCATSAKHILSNSLRSFMFAENLQ